MRNTYISANLLSLTAKGSFSFSFNDYSNWLSQGFERNQCSSQCCRCCNCSSCCASSFGILRVPTCPSLLYGLRQSTLIQCSPSRRLIFGGRDRYFYRVPTYGLDHGCNEVSCSFKEKRGSERIERRRRGKARFNDVNLREMRCLGGIDDAEALISLLSEEVSEEYLGDIERNRIVSKRVEMEKRGSYGGGWHKGREKNARIGLERDSKSEFKSETIDLGKEECRRKEDRGQREGTTVLSRRDNRKGREASSSFPSNYSLSSTGEIASNMESQEEYGDVLEEESSGHKKGLKNGRARSDGPVVEEHNGHNGSAERKGKILGQPTSETRTGINWDLRKQSEKKHTEIEENQSGRESSQMKLRMARTHESDHRKASGSDYKIDNQEEKTLAGSLEEGAREQYSQRGKQLKEQSEFRMTYQGTTDAQDIQGTSQHQKLFGSIEEKPVVDADLALERREEHWKIVHRSAREGNMKRNIQQFPDIPEAGNVNDKIVSNLKRHSESRMKVWKEDRALRSAEDIHVQNPHVGDWITGQIESRRSSQQFSEISQMADSNTREISTLEEETRMKNLEGDTSTVYGSAKEQRAYMDQKALKGIQYKQGAQDVTKMPVNVTNVSVHAINMETVNDSQGTSGKEMIEQRTTFVKPIQETGERDDQTNQNATYMKSRHEARLAAEASSFHEKTSQGSRTVVNVKKSHVEEGNQRSPHAVMMPPSPQLVARGPLCIDPAGGTATEVVCRETSESSSSAFYTNSGGRTPASYHQTSGSDGKDEFYGERLDLLIHEGTLDSARRLEESSKKLVGEFVEKARNEVLASDMQKQKRVSGTKLWYEGEKNRPKSLGQHNSDIIQLKDQDPMHSSRGSGVKGPPDEMWDVTDSSVGEPPETKAPEGSTETKNVVVKGTGGSLWSIIGNIVRLRWGSLVPISAGRSSGKSSSNDSVRSEAWFSGNEPDETSDEYVKRGKKSVSSEATSSNQLQQKSSTQVQAEAVDAAGSMDIIKQLEADAPSTSVTMKSKGISSPPEDENFGWSQDGKSFQVVNSGLGAGEPLVSSGKQSAVVEESSGTSKAYVSVSGTKELMEQPVSPTLNEGLTSEVKDVELRQRRLWRNKQVLRDRFDEWEGAYIYETEQRKNEEIYMREALLEAKKASDNWEVPVGAVLVHHGKIIARGYNLVEELRDSTAHAEIICIREASKQLRTWRLAETTLYVTLEPCPMCAGAILQARIDTLVWGAPNKLLGADGSWVRLFPNGGEVGNGSELTDKPPVPVHPFHPNMRIRRGILESECADAMQQFFRLRRRKETKNEDPHPLPSGLPIPSTQSKILSKMHGIFHIMFCL